MAYPTQPGYGGYPVSRAPFSKSLGYEATFNCAMCTYMCVPRTPKCPSLVYRDGVNYNLCIFSLLWAGTCCRSAVGLLLSSGWTGKYLISSQIRDSFSAKYVPLPLPSSLLLPSSLPLYLPPSLSLPHSLSISLPPSLTHSLCRVHNITHK